MPAFSSPAHGSRSSNGPSSHDLPMWLDVVATICLIWYTAVVLVCLVGYLQLKRYYSSRPVPSISSSSLEPSSTPHITIIRPVKGLEPHLYDCLASTFRQDYPSSHMTIYLCVSSRDDPAFPILERVIGDFKGCGARILVEEEDPKLQDDGRDRLGPNPKIRNMSRAYREAKGDVVWIIDCNVWVGKGVCGRMVDTLCGFSREGHAMPYKFVHQLPLVVDVENVLSTEEGAGLLQNGYTGDVAVPPSQRTAHTDQSNLSAVFSTQGGRLEELFLSSSHAKFYTAINTVLIAPCIVGKSNMFRRSHLDYLTSRPPNRSQNNNTGIDFFSQNICEDHLIGDLLWRGNPAPESKQKFGNHALVFGDLAIQPMANMSVPAYIARRVRWLRVRKFTVTLATLVEPGTESFLCSAYGAFALTTLPWFHKHFSIPQTWSAFSLVWLASVIAWCIVDWTLYILLHSGSTIELDEDRPFFVLPPPSSRTTRRRFREWLPAWLGREILALPIWILAFWGGVGVEWRGRRFWVGMDMRVHEVEGAKRRKGVDGNSSRSSSNSNEDSNGTKRRRD